MSKISRRKALASLAAAGGAMGAFGAFGSRMFGGGRSAGVAEAATGSEKRFLITIGGLGGASIIDSLLAIRQSESANGLTINTFPDEQVVDVGPFHAVDLRSAGLNLLGTSLANVNHADFAAKHLSDLMVATVENTSVNHVLAQKRSINGNAAWGGRTLQEMVATTYGAGCPVANANMASFGFLEPGVDTTLAPEVYPEAIANPRFWSLGLDSLKGLENAPEREVLDLAVRMRNERLDPESIFFKTFRKSRRIQKWLAQRGATRDQLQTLDLITKLTIIPDRPPEFPLAEYGLAQTPDGQRILDAFPLIEVDSLHAQAALAYLLIKYGVSVSVTISPSFSPEVIDLPGGGFLLLVSPLAFDNSHSQHRQTQGFMWSRIFDLADNLIDLLKADEYEDTGESLWDRSLLYVATDFGRTKGRPAGAVNFGSGHNLSNGAVFLCPKGRPGLYGGVDPDTGNTFGFDLQGGDPDPGRLTTERELFGGLLQLIGVDTTEAGLPDIRAFRPT